MRFAELDLITLRHVDGRREKILEGKCPYCGGDVVHDASGGSGPRECNRGCGEEYFVWHQDVPLNVLGEMYNIDLFERKAEIKEGE